MDAQQAEALRKPFPPESIGRLPKGGVMLDYVGHAAVTDRLLAVDPEWTWEPLAVTPEGLPALDSAGNLWIRLTVAGVTRIGVGDGKNAKECISDALRNAAMRFGVALALWSKDELESDHTAKELLLTARQAAWDATAHRATSDEARKQLWSDAIRDIGTPTADDYQRLAKEWTA